MKRSGRAIRIIIYSTILAGLIVYGKLYFPATTLQMCLQNPEIHDGKTINIGNEATVQKLTKDGFIIRQLGRTIPVKSSTVESLKPGVFINFTAVFHKEGWLEAKQVHVMKKRRVKIWISVLPVIVIFILFFNQFKFNFSHCYFEKR